MTTVLITGSNRGIGLEFVKRFVARDYQVIAACRDPGKADALNALHAKHSNLSIMPLDLAHPESLPDFAARLKDAPVDLLINNAGVYGPRHAEFGSVTADDWLQVLKVNTVAPLLLTQVLIENLRRGKGRKLVFITSKMGSIADNSGGGSYVYRSSKTALNQVVASLAVDLGKEGFVSVVLHPGWVQTDMGGPNALIDTNTSVSGMLSIIDGLQTADNGRFYAYDGSPIAW